MRTRTTKDERDWGLAQYEVLSRLIDEGKWEYSISKLRADFQAYQQFTWFEIHPILTVLIFLLCFPIGFIPVILLAIVLSMQKPARERYEVALGKLKHGKSFGTSTASSSQTVNLSEEISKLHELLKSGALTQAEFDEQKKRLLKAG